jgi:hypothetical protein
LKVRVWADTHSSGLIDERGAPIPRHNTSLSDETWQSLQEWVADYDHVIPLNEAARAAIRSEIDELDARGLKLLVSIQAEWPVDLDTREPIEFTYFSEGHLIPLE